MAAGHAVLAAAGGAVITPEGKPLRYGRKAENFRVPAFVAWGDPSLPSALGVITPADRPGWLASRYAIAAT